MPRTDNPGLAQARLALEKDGFLVDMLPDRFVMQKPCPYGLGYKHAVLFGDGTFEFGPDWNEWKRFSAGELELLAAFSKAYRRWAEAPAEGGEGR